MRINPISQTECVELLKRVNVGRLACSFNDHPYVVPICFSYEPEHIYVFSTVGKKIEWMRQNPNVCLQADEIGNMAHWTSVIVEGKYLELKEPQYSAERQRAIEKLSSYSGWWRTPIAERREQISDLEIEPIFFCIEIESISGLRSVPEAALG